MLSAASLVLTLSIKSCVEDKETVSGLYVSENILIQFWRYKTVAIIKCQKSHLSFIP